MKLHILHYSSFFCSTDSNYNCILFFAFPELDELTTPAPPRLYYDVEVKLVNLGDGFIAPTPGSPDFEVISNRISDSFGPVFEKLPGYYQIRLNKLQK